MHCPAGLPRWLRTWPDEASTTGYCSLDLMFGAGNFSHDGLVAILVWISMATALWHFTIFVPDRFLGGMVGAFVCANSAAVAAGLATAGFSMPAKSDVTHFDAALGGIAGAVGLAVAYAWGTRRNHRRDRFRER